MARSILDLKEAERHWTKPVTKNFRLTLERQSSQAALISYWVSHELAGPRYLDD